MTIERQKINRGRFLSKYFQSVDLTVIWSDIDNKPTFRHQSGKVSYCPGDNSPIANSLEIFGAQSYSARKACIGSTLEARAAGSQTAISATAVSRIGAAMNAVESIGFTP